MQEAYLTVDYERNYFNVSQMLWNDTAVPDVRTITSVAVMSPLEARSGLAIGTVVGIVFGILAVLLLIAALSIYLRQRHASIRRVPHAPAMASDEDDKTRLQTAQSTGCRPWINEGDVNESNLSTCNELDGTYTSKFEVSGVDDIVRELDGISWAPVEVEGNYNLVELDGRGRAAELVGVTPVYELHAQAKK